MIQKRPRFYLYGDQQLLITSFPSSSVKSISISTTDGDLGAPETPSPPDHLQSLNQSYYGTTRSNILKHLSQLASNFLNNSIFGVKFTHSMDEREIERLALALKKLKVDTDFRALRALDFSTKRDVFSSLIQGTNPSSRLLELLIDTEGIALPSARSNSDTFTRDDFQGAFFTLLAEELAACNFTAEQLANSKKACYSAIDYLVQRFQFKNVQKYQQMMETRAEAAFKGRENETTRKYNGFGAESVIEVERELEDPDDQGRDSWIKAVQREQEAEIRERTGVQKGLQKAPAAVLPAVASKDTDARQSAQKQQKKIQQLQKNQQNKQKPENPHSLSQMRAQVLENPADLNLQLMYQEELLIQYQAQIRQHQKQLGVLGATTVNMYQRLKNNTSLEAEQLKKAIQDFQNAKEIDINEYEHDMLQLKQQLNQKTRIKNQNFFNDVYQLRKILKAGNKDEIAKQVDVVLGYYEQGDGNANLWADVYDVNHY